MVAKKWELELKGTFEFMAQTMRLSAETAAEAVIKDLKEAGPYYSGTFERSWVALPGRTPIPATVHQVETGDSSYTAANLSKVVTPYIPPPIPYSGNATAFLKKGATYTLGNKTVYRALAMDLIPGRLEGKGQNVRSSAPRNWYTSYVNGGALDITVKEAIRAAASEATRRSSISS